MNIYEIAYRLGQDELEEKLKLFIAEQRLIKKAGSGDIDEIRLITGMRVVHYGAIGYSDGKELNLPQKEDIITISIKIGEISTFYAAKDQPDFTVIELHGHKYMIQIEFNTLNELSRLLTTSARQLNFAQKVDKDIREHGSISKEK